MAWIDGEPAATAASVLFARSVYLLGGVTVERFRGRGAYHALVATRLAHARAHGIALATTIARADTSAPILEQLGFERICRFDNYIG
jgi:N-acetylglutamate synthase-like GNAT family acetyltransferase